VDFKVLFVTGPKFLAPHPF